MARIARQPWRAITGSADEQRHKQRFSFDTDHPEVFASEDHGATPVEYVLVGFGRLSQCRHRGRRPAPGHSTACRQRHPGGKHATFRGSWAWTARYAMASTMSGSLSRSDAEASREAIEALVAQSQKRSAVYDILDQSHQRLGNREMSGVSRRAAASFRAATVVVIGAGQAGLAMSHHRQARSIDHVGT